jgi:hypothetical protein
MNIEMVARNDDLTASHACVGADFRRGPRVVLIWVLPIIQGYVRLWREVSAKQR